ncbi:MAG: NUDIX hydrolase [Thermodesulfobacteriota bacterium]|nr:MAG: NUDIX hydrolase [Thermodesulfobacteriota bacterium]RLG13049.1 MAG: NUDIX hydrolase [Candidatus Pacearchaeota archaeon]
MNSTEKLRKKGRKPKETPESLKREYLEIIDENCNPIGILSRAEIHQKDFFHKSVHIFIFNKQGEIYLQKKSKIMDENPGLWSSSASGHVAVGETFLIAAQRELKEELSIKVKLEEVLRIKPTEEGLKKCIVLFKGITGKIPKPNPIEIEEGRFFSIEEVNKLIQQKPEIFTPTFKILWKKYWYLVNQGYRKEK